MGVLDLDAGICRLELRDQRIHRLDPLLEEVLPILDLDGLRPENRWRGDCQSGDRSPRGKGSSGQAPALCMVSHGDVSLVMKLNIWQAYRRGSLPRGGGRNNAAVDIDGRRTVQPDGCRTGAGSLGLFLPRNPSGRSSGSGRRMAAGSAVPHAFYHFRFRAGWPHHPRRCWPRSRTKSLFRGIVAAGCQTRCDWPGSTSQRSSTSSLPISTSITSDGRPIETGTHSFRTLSYHAPAPEIAHWRAFGEKAALPHHVQAFERHLAPLVESNRLGAATAGEPSCGSRRNGRLLPGRPRPYRRPLRCRMSGDDETLPDRWRHLAQPRADRRSRAGVTAPIGILIRHGSRGRHWQLGPVTACHRCRGPLPRGCHVRPCSVR